MERAHSELHPDPYHHPRSIGAVVAGQLHSSLNGGSLEQGRIDGLREAPPFDADKLLDAAPLLDVDTLGDP